ncbi:MAG: sulfatase-like hydrolase/transferase [Acidobacteriota bacterium]|nr:sulfatase-like hydrolase/transferase [Acidobacteriota bacterium]
MTDLRLRLALPAALLAAALTAACAGPAAPERPNLVFVVLDNVRSDRLSLCGYERPTSPFLVQLCGREGSRCTCDAQAPSSWTLPAHASYFTGAEVPQHGAGKGGDDEGNVRLGPGTHARPLDDALPTLAETLGERGYQTVLVSGNPLVSPASGLTRGFTTVRHASFFGEFSGPGLPQALEDALESVEPPSESAAPLFLFVNIANAHRPWPGVPERVDWLPPRLMLSFPQKAGRPNPQRRSFITGTMDPDEAAELVAHLGDVYDFSVRSADRTLRLVLRTLREGGWIGGERPFRVVVTSDHGEHLGERGLMGHADPYLYEELTRVPLAVYGSAPIPELPRQIAALASYDLLLDGRPRRRPVRALAFASDTWPRWYRPGLGSRPGAAIWNGSEKFVSHDGEILRYDLAEDPGELAPERWTEEETVAELEALLAALEASASGEPPSPEMLELLRSLGYL